jgi:hypothetical protein
MKRPERKPVPKFPCRPCPLNEDPLRGAYGLSWWERKPSSLSPEEWEKLDRALGEGKINSSDYAEWKLYVK